MRFREAVAQVVENAEKGGELLDGNARHLAAICLGNLKLEDPVSFITGMLEAKNHSYGNSALNPVRVYSQCSAEEAIMVRIDDKLSRIIRGKEYQGDDTWLDLLGYLVLLEMAK
jgi:hypothetical protein